MKCGNREDEGRGERESEGYKREDEGRGEREGIRGRVRGE